jgi:hypothetical protein
MKAENETMNRRERCMRVRVWRNELTVRARKREQRQSNV